MCAPFVRFAPFLALLALLANLVSGCGYTEEEMAAKQRQIDVLTAKVTALRTEGHSAACQFTSSSSSQRRR